MVQDGDTYSDSGWRIQGFTDGSADPDGDGRAPESIAIGKVLNADDNWPDLIDAPVGSAFLRQPGTDIYVPAD